MSLPRHLILALTYGVIAIAVALTLPYSVPAIGKWNAIGIGALILIFGAVLHEAYSRQVLERELRVELGRLADARDEVMGELSAAREEMHAIQRHLKTGPASPAALDRVQDEVRVLHEAYSRQVLERELRVELGRLADARDEVMGELSAAREEMHAIQRHLQTGPASPAALDRVQDEVRVLQNLVSRLTGRRAGRPQSAGPLVLDRAMAGEAAVDALSEDDLASLLEDAIRRDRVDMALQPIVSLPQRKTRYYEALCRIRTDDGGHIPAGRFIDLAERLGLVTAIDNVLLFRCVQLVRDAVRRHRLVGFFANVSVDTLSEDGLATLLEDAIRRDRIDMALQPIVSLPQRKTRYYEALCRIRTDDGAHIPAGRFIDLAERLGLVTAIDNVLLFRCVQLVRDAIRRHRLVGFFANVSVDTLRDDEFMQQFIEFVAGAPDLASRLVFEIGAADFREAGETLWPPLERLASMGFRFSVDRTGNLASLDVDALERRFVRFVKIDAATLIAETRDAESAAGLLAIKQRLDESAIDLIVDRIETEPELVELLDLPVDFGQGLLFGEPRTS